MDRREFGRGAGALVASAWVGCKRDEPASTAPASPTAEEAVESGLLFAPDESSALEAALGRLVPSADRLRLSAFVEEQLTRPGTREFAQLMRSGGRALNAGARKDHKIRWFRDLSAEQADRVLVRFQTGEIRLGRFDAARFFEVLRTFALEGWMSDPATLASFGIRPPSCP